MTKADLARKWLDENNPANDLPSMTVAKRIYDEYPGTWPNLHAARICVNGIRGSGSPRSMVTHPRPHGHQGDRPPMPPALRHETGVWVARPGLYLILGDVHVPYHVPEVVETALSHRTRLDGIVLNGDALNNERLGRFTPSFGAPSAIDEKRTLGMFLDWMVWGDVPVYYKLGNHEERWWSYLATKVPEIAEDPEMDFAKWFGLDVRGVEAIGGGSAMTFGKLWGYHGHEVSRNSPFTPDAPAKWLMQRTGVSAFCGHFHRSHEYSTRRADGTVIACWTVGCACDLSPRYAPNNQWNHGFAFVEFDESGNFELRNHKVIDGKVY